MPKELKQVRKTKKAVYPDTQKYLGKPSFAEEVESGAGDEEEENADGRSPVGVLGDLPPEIQDYVLSKVSRNMQQSSGAGENMEMPDVQYDENGEIVGEPVQGQEQETSEEASESEQSEPESVQDLIDDLFDSPLMTPELQEKLESFKEAIEEMQETQRNNAEIEEQQQKDDSTDSTLEDFTPKEAQQEPSESSQDSQNGSGEQESSSGECSCTEAERAFLDAFMALQEGGALLGMIPSTRWLPKIQNIDIGGIRNISILPTVASMNPEDEQEAHSLLKVQADLLFDSCETMLKEHNIK